MEGLSVLVSLPVNLGDFIGRARLQSDLTYLLRLLINRIEDMSALENEAGDRLLGLAAPTGETVPYQHDRLYEEQREAVASGLGRDTTFIWGPPGTGKTVTIGVLATELHQRNRSVLLVSHTNAAVDQAILRVTEVIGREELEKGLVLRLGDTKEPRITEHPELLVETHIQRRSAEILTERKALTTEQLATTENVAVLDRLISIAEWLSEAPQQIDLWQSSVNEHASTLSRREAQSGLLATIDLELKPLHPLKEPARQALADDERIKDLNRVIPQQREHLAGLRKRLATSQANKATAEALLHEAREHVPNVRSARSRLAALRAELPEREPLLAATDQELDELRQSIADGEVVLARAVQSNMITRRLRGLPHPDEQRRLLDSLRTRDERLADARRQTAVAIENLRVEFLQAQEIIDEFGHLPDPDVQHEEAQRLRQEEDRLNFAVTTAAKELDEAEGDLRELANPQERFRALHRMRAQDVLDEVARLESDAAPIRNDIQHLDSQIAAIARSLRDGLQQRALDLGRLDLIDNISDDFGEMLSQVRSAMGRGFALVHDRPVEEMLEERAEFQKRLSDISERLDEIEDTLKDIELLVIAEARVVATTLTRAYKRNSIQARRFDTVILDEASMAPIPALWVVAARAEHNVVIVGDFRQLPPIKHSTHELAERWLGTDIFEIAGVREAFDKGHPLEHCVALKEQHRMHPAISAIANHFVYGGMLRNGAGVDNDEMLQDWFLAFEPFDDPVVLVDTSKLNAWVTSVNNAGRTSRLNFLSASVCADIAHLLLRPERDPFQPGDKPRILLAAPYRPHAKLMSVLAKDQSPSGEVIGGTAHTFQGNEAPVVIFDLVNDEPHWRVGMFGTNMEPSTKRMMNVALTRAQRRLIIVGDFKWIEQKAKKGVILRRLIAYLKEHFQVVDAGDIIPAGLAARAAATQRSTVSDRSHPIEPQLVVTQDRFFDLLYEDLAQAKERVVIYSPFMTADRIGRLEPHLRACIERGVQVWVITKTVEERLRDASVYEGLERALRSWGVLVVHKRHMHEKLVIIDDGILWQGSLNPLSFSSTQEIMERRESKDIIKDYTRVLRLDDLLAPYTNEETACPYCGNEVVAAEGAGEPFYWRCVVDHCFSRSIGDPMPVDGRVICRVCGGGLEFRWPNDRPFWRCTTNHRHRQLLARGHLRLPRMRQLVPNAELRKLSKRLGIDLTEPTITRSTTTRFDRKPPTRERQPHMERINEEHERFRAGRAPSGQQ